MSSYAVLGSQRSVRQSEHTAMKECTSDIVIQEVIGLQPGSHRDIHHQVTACSRRACARDQCVSNHCGRIAGKTVANIWR